MAFTERYVTDAAGGGGVGTEGDPWTLAQALTSAVAGDRVNILSDSGYSLGADTVSGIGTAVDVIVFRGYNSSIGDLQNPGRSSSTGKLDTTGFPAITITGILTPNAFVIFQNLAFTGALSSAIVGSTSIDNWFMVECEVINTQNNSAAKAILGDNFLQTVSCDFECTGAAHNVVVDSDNSARHLYTRVKSIANDGIQFNSGSTIIGCLLIGNGVGQALAQTNAGILIAVGNTVYNWATGIEQPNLAPTTIQIIINNHITDCSKYFDNLYSATDNIILIEVNNRTRDNTTPRTGVGDGILSGEVTTDTGDASTDYTNAGADDLSLIAAAPGIDTGLGFGT